jgi:hypothetical protein
VSLSGRAIACAALVGLGAVGAPGCVGLGALSASAGPDGGDAALADDASPLDGASGDAASCDTLGDPQNCGRCGHDCLGGKCTAGACEPVGLAAIGGAPLARIALAPGYVFVSTHTTRTTETGGLWRIPRVGGAAELFVPMRFSEEMVVVGDTLYFTVAAPPGAAADQQGGLYSCALAAPAPCVPSLIAASDRPSALTVDQGRVVYADASGVNSYVPPRAPMPLTSLPLTALGLFADGDALFYVFMNSAAGGKMMAGLSQFTPSTGTSVDLYLSIGDAATPGLLVGSPDALYVAIFDALATTSSVVRRVPRNATTTPCNYGGSGNLRPYGIHTDTTRIYWTNQGAGAAPPYTNGSVVSCALAGCCATPTVHWIGQGQPTAITGDDNALYFVTSATSFVYRLAKP